MELLNLGDDVCSVICTKLSVRGLASLAQTSRRFAHLIRTESKIWRGIHSPGPHPAPSLHGTPVSREQRRMPAVLTYMSILQRSAAGTTGRCPPRKLCAGEQPSSSGRCWQTSQAGVQRPASQVADIRAWLLSHRNDHGVSNFAGAGSMSLPWQPRARSQVRCNMLAFVPICAAS